MRKAYVVLLALTLLVLVASSASESSQVLLNPKYITLNDAGVSMRGCIYTYEAGTTTKKTTYSDKTLTTANSNPIQCDTRGECGPIYFEGLLKVVMTNPDGSGTCPDSPTNIEYTVDNIEGAGSSILDFQTCSDFSDLKTAIDTIGSTETTLYVDCNATLTANLIVPANIHLVFLKGYKVTTGTYTLTINGPMTAGRFQVFDTSGGGSVSFAANSVAAIYPEWWGALGDGSTDSTSAFQAAFAAISSVGGTVVVSNGTYLISSSVSMYDNSTLILESGGILKASSPCTMIRNASWSSPGNKNITIIGHGGIIDGNNRTHLSTSFLPGIALRYVKDCRVQGVIVWDTPGPAINFEQTGGRCIASNNIINGDPTGVGRILGGVNYPGCDGAITVQDAVSPAISELIVESNIIENCQEGIGFNAETGVTNLGRVVCANNIIREISGGDGITFAGYSNFTCTGNYVETVKNNGIGVRLYSENNAKYCSIVGNTVKSAGYYAGAGQDAHGIKIGRSSSTDDGYMVIANNTIINPGNTTAGGDGIRLSINTHHVALTGNVIYGAVEYGVYCAGSSGNKLKNISITGGSITNNGKAGISAYYADYLTISGVVVTDNGSTETDPYGITMYACDRAVVSGVLATDTGSGYQDRGIRAAGTCTNVAIVGNNLYGNVLGPFSNIPDGALTSTVINNYGAYDSYYTLPTGATPSVASGYMFTTANTSATNVNNLVDGYKGKIITIRGNDGGNTTIVNGSAIKTKTGTNVTLANGAIIILQLGSDNVWYEL